jgi:hypothetical protein
MVFSASRLAGRPDSRERSGTVAIKVIVGPAEAQDK